MDVLSCGLLYAKSINHLEILDVISPARHTQKSLQHVRARATRVSFPLCDIRKNPSDGADQYDIFQLTYEATH